MFENLLSIASRFNRHGRIIDVREFGNGNINNTFLVELADESEKHFILQRINTHVFRRPELVMRNMRIATEHINKRLERDSIISGRRWEVPRILLAEGGRDHWIAPNGSFWRALSFIESARSFDAVRDIGHAREVGCALGLFHTLLSDLAPESLADTLPGFHITPLYLCRYEEVLAKKTPPKTKTPEVNYCLRFAREHEAFANVLEDARAEGKLSLRPIHGDPKVNNFLLDSSTGECVSIIDLDTVKPGLVHYDIGDCLRSACNPMGEEIKDWEQTRFDTDVCRALLAGYFSRAREFLTGHDIDHIYDSVRLIAFELGLRFFTDYLEGDVYFKVKNPEHNLRRALVQFKLAESIESQGDAIGAIIRDLT